MVRLKSSIQKFYCHYHDLVYRNRISVIIDYGYVQLAALPGLFLIHSLSPYICNQRNMTGAISGTRTAYPFGIHGFAPGFSGARVARSLVLCVVGFFFIVVCPFSFDHCVFCRFTDSDYPFGLVEFLLHFDLSI